MTATLRAVGAASGNAGATTPGLPSGWQVGDIHFLFCHYKDDSGNGTAGPSGWTLLPGLPVSTGANSTALKVWWRRAQSGDTAPTVIDQDQMQYTVIVGFHGCTAIGNPWSVVASASDATDDQAGSILGATTLHDDCLVITAITHGNDVATASWASWSNGDLTDFSEIHDAGSTSGTGGGIGIATWKKATAGAYGATAVTLPAGRDSPKCMITIALKPGTVDTVLDRFQVI